MRQINPLFVRRVLDWQGFSALLESLPAVFLDNRLNKDIGPFFYDGPHENYFVIIWGHFLCAFLAYNRRNLLLCKLGC